MAFALDTQDADLAFGLFCQLPVYGSQVNELVVFDPTPLLALPGATEHPGSAVALLSAGFAAWRRGDAQQALALCDEALAVEQRLGPTGARLAFWSSQLRGNVAQAAGATEEAVDHFLECRPPRRRRRRPRTRRLLPRPRRPHPLVFGPGDRATTRAWLDSPSHAKSGCLSQSPTTSSVSPRPSAASDPEQARALLSEALQLATTLGYENPQELLAAVFCAARLDEWPTTLYIAGRVLHHHVRSGALGLVSWPAVLNLVARGLAEHSPVSAATIQGTVSTVVRRITPDVAAPVKGGASSHNDVAAFVARVRRDTTQLLTAALGDPRLRELRAQGAAMDETQACTYARTHIDEYLAASTLNENA